MERRAHMSDLISALKKQISFDEGDARKHVISENNKIRARAKSVGLRPMIMQKSFVLGSSWQSERLKPVLLAMVSACEQLEHNTRWIHRMAGLQWDNPDYAPNFKAHANRASECLVRLKEAVEAE